MIDIKSIEEQARKELMDELSKSAVTKLKAKMREITMAERVLVNLRQELEVLKRDLGSDSEAA